jgi:hypothetical protein
MKLKLQIIGQNLINQGPITPLEMLSILKIVALGL